MDWLTAIILGIVEGITEFLPISSTGHLILATRVLGISSTEFVKSFEIAIQLGAILSVVVLYGKSLLRDRRVLARVAAAFVPTAIVGLLFYKLIKKHLLGSEETVVWALFVGGILLIVFEWLHKEKPGAESDLAKLPYSKAIAIGIFQSLAVVPGVSRAAATIVGGLLLGLKRKAIVEFSFLLAVPTMAAAAGLDLIKSAGSFSAGQFQVLFIGFAASFVTALLAIKFLLHFIKHNSFMIFGIYRIVVALVFWLIF